MSLLRFVRRSGVVMLIALTVVFAGFNPIAVPSTSAAPGALVKQFTVPVKSPIGVGTSIAFDGKNLMYTNWTDPHLYKLDSTGKLLSTVTITGITTGNVSTALAWDGKRKQLWVTDGGANFSQTNGIYLLDSNTGVAQLQFKGPAFDGLAYDGSDDTLYMSVDASCPIYHYSVTGTRLNTLTCSIANSGLAIGGGVIYAGSDGQGIIYKLDKKTGATLGTFASPGGRDEDLECDSVSFSPKSVMWSKDAYNDQLTAFEVEPGTCAVGGGVDSDGDGLLDEWEVGGVTIDGGAGPQFIDLPKMGANKDKPDIFIQLDWMAGTVDQKPDPSALKLVHDAFANAPKPINLHIDAGPDSVMDYSTNPPTLWGSLSRAGARPYEDTMGSSLGGDWQKDLMDNYVAKFFTPTGRTPIFHYALFAHKYNTAGNSGIAFVPGSYLIVSLGGFINSNGGKGTPFLQASSLMHELGHNLGLDHGGGDGRNYKPNYLSIMSYAFQLDGLNRAKQGLVIDYSRKALPTLNETSLNEPAGLGPDAAGAGTRHWCTGPLFGLLGGSRVPVADGSQPIDWNCDNQTTDTNVAADINGEDGISNVPMQGYDDWGHLQYKGGGIGLAGVPPTSIPLGTLHEETMNTDLAKVAVAPWPVVQLLPQPLRLADTRTSGGAIATGTSRCFAVAAAAGTPSDATAIVLNVTAVGYATQGWLTVYPNGQAVPSTSTVNFDPGEYATANGTVVRLGDGGQVCVSVGTINSAPGGAHVIIDATGFLSNAALSRLPMLTAPQRLADTRTSGGPIATGTSRCFTLAGVSGIPADAAAVVLNVTAVGYVTNGWLTVYPAGQSVPATSTLNFDKGQYAVANGAIMGMDTNGKVCVQVGTINSAPGSSHVILDVVGYVTTDGLAQVSMLPSPQRLADTRTSGGPIASGTSRCFTLAGVAGIPADATAVLLNVTAAGYVTNGWVTAYPAGQPVPATSTLNFDTNQYAVANGAIMRVGTSDQVCASVGTINSAPGGSQVIMDVVGYVTH